MKIQKYFNCLELYPKIKMMWAKNFGYKILGTDNDLPHLVKKYKYIMIGAGFIKNINQKKKIFYKLKKNWI